MSTDLSRRGLVAGAAALAATPAMPARAQAETVLRVAMTLSDVPYLGGQPDQGGEGWRFVGVTLHDSLVGWDLSQRDKPSTLIPGLAQEWEADPADRTKWTFKLRPGVRFHDGSAFDADAVLWNMRKLMDPQAPQYDSRQNAQTYGRMNLIAGVEKLDDLTVVIRTKAPDALVPWYFGRILISSPAQWEKVGRSWEAFARNPSGRVPGSSTGWCRASGWSWCATPTTGTRRGCRRRTGWCCCRSRMRIPASRRCSPASATSSRHRRRTPRRG